MSVISMLFVQLCREQIFVVRSRMTLDFDFDIQTRSTFHLFFSNLLTMAMLCYTDIIKILELHLLLVLISLKT